MYAVFLAASISYGPTDDVSAAIAIALAMAQRKPSKAEIEPIDEPKQTWPTYTEARKKAATTGSVMLIFVGVEPRLIPRVDAIVTYSGKLTGYDSPCVVVSKQGGEYWYATLPSDANDYDIARTVGTANERQVSHQQAVPFQPPTARLEAHADAGSLPAAIREMLKGAERYQRARFTQSIAIVNNRDDIRPVPREQTEMKYQVPGGLEGIHGWASDLYRSENSSPNVRIVNIPVLNSLGYFQNNRGYARAYPIGTWFADVLSKDGKAFEVRVREKEETGWVSYVAWKNVSARPAGYVGAMQSCASCHQEAGSGKYGVGLVPGGDETISDPFPQLER